MPSTYRRQFPKYRASSKSRVCAVTTHRWSLQEIQRWVIVEPLLQMTFGKPSHPAFPKTLHRPPTHPFVRGDDIQGEISSGPHEPSTSKPSKHFFDPPLHISLYTTFDESSHPQHLSFRLRHRYTRLLPRPPTLHIIIPISN